ncbi:MAG: permease-like cell division protein FtsX [Bacteroidota bacterium]|nr:permease-like cell division protein FtsX [Bacteroidota bacterium]
MGSSFEKYQKRRLISSYFSVVISIALVLFLLGLLVILVLNAKFITDEFKEKVVLTIYLEDDTKAVEINQLKNSLILAEYVKKTQFISKDAAASFMKNEYGENFLDEVGYNPLKNSIEVNLLADYVTAKRLDSLSDKALQKNFVEDVKYDKDLVTLMNSNVKRLSLWVLIICGIFTLIAVLLINSSIRLAVYSKRFSIKTMQMVGATKSFIRRPFVWHNIRLGILGGLIAISGNAVLLYYIDLSFSEFKLMQQPTILIGALFTVLAIGIFITWISTHLATRRFLNLKTEQLHY